MPELSYEAIADGLNVCTSQWHRFGTDAVLLAEFSAYRRKERVCDLGTGCGIIPMLMQRKDAPQEVYGVDVSDDALRKAVAEHNEVCRILTEIGQFRKEENPRITGYEYHILNLVSYCCPKYLIVEKLRETLEELRQREPDAKPRFRVKIAVVGSEIDDPGFTKLVEDAGALVVVDRFCFGSTPGREEIHLDPDLPVLKSIARHYLSTSQCPRFMQREKVDGRWQLVRDLCAEYHAQGVLYEQLKFCEYWGYERALASHVVTREFGIPSVAVDRQNATGGSGQLRTRVQAFVESLEIKQLQTQRGGK